MMRGDVKPRLRVLTSLPLIVLAALAIRAAFVWNYQAHTPHRGLAAIPFLFESGNIAYSLARGHGFGSPLRIETGPTAWMTPLYPLLLSGVMRVFGIYTFQSWVAAVAINVCLSCLVCVPLYYAGKRIGGTGVAAAAAWLWAVFPNAIQLSFQSLWDTSLSALLGATALWATLRLADSTRRRDWIVYGLLWGVVLMANAAVLSMFPFLLAWAVYCGWKSGKAWLPNAIWAVAIVILCCLPWTIRNYLTFHSLVPLRSTLGLQLWVGNNPKARPIWLGENHPINDASERQQYIEQGEIAYMESKRRNAVSYVLTHPGHEAQLIAGRFVMFWSGGSLNPLSDLIKNPSNWFRFVLLFNLAVAAGTLAGMVLLTERRSPFAFPLAVGPVVFPIAYYMTLALPRYRHPIDPTLILLTVVAVAGLSRKRRTAQVRTGAQRR
jgi:hypothetical protein